ncbi:MAG: tetratricopeptide repeat protein, partial [Spirochaetaceae bacterium]|nr:tetratricopeptide repeat protein [Spirochaetaceae bacterium]
MKRMTAAVWVLACAGTLGAADLVSLDQAVAAAAAVEAAEPAGAEIAVAQLEAPLPSISKFLIDRLNARFVANRKLKVLARGEALDFINSEHQFQMTGLVSDLSAVGIGHFLGAKAVITGTFERFSSFSQLWVRAVDVETSQVLAMRAALIRNDDPVLAEITRPLGAQNAPAVTENALDRLTRGKAAFAQGDYDLAIANYTAALGIDPNYADASYNRGIAYYNKKDYDRAVADFTAALGINPNFADAYVYRGIAYRNKGDYDKAVADYTQALKIQPDYASALSNRGNVYYNRKEYDRAIADYNAALRINPNFADAYCNRGFA